MIKIDNAGTIVELLQKQIQSLPRQTHEKIN